jgi:ketosteroid isomerase-like protein
MAKNLDALRKMDEGMQSGDPDAMLSAMTDDVVVHIGGNSKLAGDLKGKQELMENFGKFMQVIGEDAEFETHAILADDEHGVILQRVKISEAWFADLDPHTADKFYDSQT